MEKQEEKKKEVLTADDVQALAPLYSDVVLALKQVYDPEIPVNIYDLGLIYELTINKEHDVFIEMTFTAPNCPMADEVLAEVQHSVEDVPGVKSCHISGTRACCPTRRASIWDWIRWESGNYTFLWALIWATGPRT